jgi:hypothetical protein
MKKSQLKQLIKEEIRKIISEDYLDNLLNSIENFDPNDTSKGIDIGSNVAVIKYGAGTIIDINDNNKTYKIKLLDSKKEIEVPFGMVQATSLNKELPVSVLNKLEKLNKEYLQYKKFNIKNLLMNNPEEFYTEKWKLEDIVQFCTELGQKMWDIAKQNPKDVLYSDEFEDLFFLILNDLVKLKKLDKGENENLINLTQAYSKIGNIIGAGVE